MTSQQNCVWVAGEVLIDLIRQGSESKAIVGGGPANTAVALSRLGINTCFIDGISTDDYGIQAKKVLIDAGVNLGFAEYSDKPTCIADVTLDQSGSATYEFLIDGTATFDFNGDWLPNPTENSPTVLYLGTLAAIVEPGATALFQWAREVSKFAPIIYDPNVRTSILSDRSRYQKSVAKWVSISKVVKVSSDDLEWLYPGETFDAVAARWLNAGVELAVLTRGPDGLRAITNFGEISVPGMPIIVVDTVGAGDTVGAILVEAVTEQGLESLRGDELVRVLNRAARAAAITCSRPGANPPSKLELDQSIVS